MSFQVMRVLTTSTALLLVVAFSATATAQSDLQAARNVKDYYNDWLSSIPGVSSVDVGAAPNGVPEIEIQASVVTQQVRQIPHQLNGIPVVVVKNPRDPNDLNDDALDAGSGYHASSPTPDNRVDAPPAGVNIPLPALR